MLLVKAEGRWGINSQILSRIPKILLQPSKYVNSVAQGITIHVWLPLAYHIVQARPLITFWVAIIRILLIKTLFLFRSTHNIN